MAESEEPTPPSPQFEVGGQPIYMYPSETVDKVISPVDIFDKVSDWVQQHYWGLINTWQTTNFYKMEDIEERHFRARAQSALLIDINLTEDIRIQMGNAEDMVDSGLAKSLDGQTAKRILPNMGIRGEGPEKKKKWGLF